MIYNQKEHEKWQKKAETDIACVLVLADFEMRKHAFLHRYVLDGVECAVVPLNTQHVGLVS
jgi:hypothetical protein